MASDERLLPRGHDSGLLWRADMFGYMLEADDGVFIEMETLGLSRPFPPMLRWVLDPIARQLGRKRKSVETSF